MQWGLLRYSAPISLNNALLNVGVVLEGYSRVIKIAIETFFKFPFTQTPRYLFFQGTTIDAGDMDERMGMGPLGEA